MYENSPAASASAPPADITVTEVDVLDDGEDGDELAEAIVEESEEDLLDEPATVIDTITSNADDGTVEEIDETVLDGRGEVIASSVEIPPNAVEAARAGDDDDDDDDALAGAGLGLGDVEGANEIAV